MNPIKDTAVSVVVGFSLIAILIMVAVSAWAWPQLPSDALVPVHWNIDGEPDRFGSKFSGLFTLPLITAGLTLIFIFLPYVDPKKNNLVRSQKAYLISWAVITIFMLLTHIVTTLNIVGRDVDVATTISIGLGVMFLIIGNYMGKIRRNFMFGIRTPWTLSSELAWNKTHRLGGKLFMLVGALVILSGIFVVGRGLVMYILLGGILGATVILFTYSYFIWKADPDVSL
ncbi:MAG: SdpI family protein [Chloroflexota bacterium]